MAQEALTGYRKYRSPFVAEINARKQYLPALYNQRRSDLYNKQKYNLEKQGLEQSRQFSLKNLELAEDAARQAKKRDKLAATLGYAGLGLQAGFGLENAFNISDLFGAKDIVEPGFDFTSDFSGEFLQAPIQEAFTGGSDYIRDVAGFGAESIFGGLVESALDLF